MVCEIYKEGPIIWSETFCYVKMNNYKIYVAYKKNANKIYYARFIFFLLSYLPTYTNV